MAYSGQVIDNPVSGDGMDPAAFSTGTVIAGNRSGAGPWVIVVGGGLQRRVIGAATAQLAVQVLVVVLGAWPVRGLQAGGPLHARLVVDEPGLAVDGGRPLLPEGHLAGRAGPGSAGRRRAAAEEAEPSAVGLPFEAAAPAVSRHLFRREGEYWTVCYEGAVVRLRDAKGLRHLARLLADPGREFHVVDLEAANRQPCSPAAVGPTGRAGAGELQVRPDLGDAGALLDATAKAAYQARLAELRAELEEAEGFNDPARAAKARQETEFLVAELARAVGLGGRDRRAASHAERARLNVTRAIRAAVANLARDNPALGRHLAATIRTGRYCAYLPDPRAPIAWNADPGHRPPGLNTGAPGLNAHPADEGSARRRSRRAQSRRPRVAAAVLIRLWIEGSQPPAGTAATEGSEPLRFDGWLELLRVVSELVAAAPSSDEDADAAG